MLPLVVQLYVLTLISVMTLNCHMHSCNDDDDDGLVRNNSKSERLSGC